MNAMDSRRASNNSKASQFFNVIKYIKESIFLTFIVYPKVWINSHLGYKGCLIPYFEHYDKFIREWGKENGYEVDTFYDLREEGILGFFWTIKW